MTGSQPLVQTKPVQDELHPSSVQMLSPTVISVKHVGHSAAILNNNGETNPNGDPNKIKYNKANKRKVTSL